MTNKGLTHYKTISEFHQSRNLSPPEHPLISIIDLEDLQDFKEPINMVLDFYSISLKRNFNGKFSYGQGAYDFNEGLMYFISPKQVYKIEYSEDEVDKKTGWILHIHPDFFWKSSLAKNIKKYSYFDYTINEALFLSKKEEKIINTIIENIQQEYNGNIDKFSQSIIISQIETLLNYCDRFYQRQFITRSKNNDKVLIKLEKLLAAYFDTEDLRTKGLPTVQYVSKSLNMSPSYLSNLLKSLTGQSTQQHIHNKLIDKAKEKLSITNLSVSEIAFELGFEHSQSFSKMFKLKVNSTPSEFRQSFN